MSENEGDGTVLTGFAAKLAAMKAKQAAAGKPVIEAGNVQRTPPAAPEEEKFQQDVPEVYKPGEGVISEDEQRLDNAIKNLDIIDAYLRWCGKMVPYVGNKRESIMISCPVPGHIDDDPSAWINLDKQVWYCPKCDMGGDLWDIAAFKFGYNVPGYKSDPQAFRNLRKEIGDSLGFKFESTGGKHYVVPPASVGASDGHPEDAPTPQVVQSEPQGQPTGNQPEAVEASNSPAVENRQAPPGPQGTLGKLPGAIQQEQEEKKWQEEHATAATIDWRAIVPRDTFLYEWLTATTVDDCPVEFHFWTGLMALGLTVGRNRTLQDEPSVLGNLYVCLTGPSGSGKSRAKRHLINILQHTQPWDHQRKVGIKHIGQPGSGEYIVAAFDEIDELEGRIPVRGLLSYDEFANLVATGVRVGSTVAGSLLELYDAPPIMSSGAGSGKNKNERIAENPFGSVISTTQTGSIKNLLDKKDDVSGLMSRWVFASGQLKPPRAIGQVAVNLSVPTGILNRIYDDSKIAPVDMPWTPQAAELWTEFFLGTVHPTKVQSEKQGIYMLQRLDLLMKKLIMLFSANMEVLAVPKAAVEQAIKVFPYFMATYGVVNTEMEKTDLGERADVIVDFINEYIKANKIEPTRGAIWQRKRKSFKDDNTAFIKMLENMVNIGILVKYEAVGKQKGDRYGVAAIGH